LQLLHHLLFLIIGSNIFLTVHNVQKKTLSKPTEPAGQISFSFITITETFKKFKNYLATFGCFGFQTVFSKLSHHIKNTFLTENSTQDLLCITAFKNPPNMTHPNINTS
jgi:hypothetical protein